MRAISLLLLFFSFSNIAFADSDSSGHAGKWFFLWGYNRDFYQNSDISLHGTDANGTAYNYTLHDTAAHDEQSSPSFQLLFPDITIPQTNERIGYYLDETHRINFGVDHMKYVVTQGQTVPVSGTNIVCAACSTGSTQLITTDYMEYEHTDGLNYISVGYEVLYPFWENSLFKLSAIQGPDAGIVYPKTNVTMKGAGALRHDDFNIAGYGAAYKVGLIADIGRSWFLQLDAKAGILNMPWIRIDNNPNDGASQKIQFFEAIMALGYVF